MDANIEELDLPTESELEKDTYKVCLKCKNPNNNPMYQFCAKCFQVNIPMSIH